MLFGFLFPRPLYEFFVFKTELQKNLSYGLIDLLLHRIRAAVEIQHRRNDTAAVLGGPQHIAQMDFRER